MEIMESELRELKREVKRLKRLSNEAADGQQVCMSDSDLLLKQVDHLNEINEVLKKMCFAQFTKDELVSCSRTGKKTCHSPGNTRPALDKAKMEALETAMLRKFPTLTADVLHKKIDNIIKTTRRGATKELSATM